MRCGGRWRAWGTADKSRVAKVVVDVVRVAAGEHVMGVVTHVENLRLFELRSRKLLDLCCG